MHTFKLGLASFFRHPIYLLIYVLFLSLMGVFIGMSSAPAEVSDDYVERPSVAVIDRDGGVLATGLAAFLGENSEPVEIADTERALQDAIMQGQAGYIAIIPAGFTEGFFEAARSGDEAPVVETVLGRQSVATYMMDELVDEYLRMARLYAVSAPDMGEAVVVDHVNDAMARSADVSVIRVADDAPMPNRFLIYLQFASYTISISIGVCVAVVMSKLNREEVRRRNAASPTRPLSRSLQMAAACLVLALLCWAFVSALGLVVFSSDLAGVEPGAIASALTALLCFAVFGLAFGFFLGQLTGNELVMNAVANIVGLVMAFLGGVWIPLSLVGEPVTTIARFIPTFYYVDAVSSALDPASTTAASPGLPVDLGIILLFAFALFAVALAIAHMRAAGSRTTRTAVEAAA